MLEADLYDKETSEIEMISEVITTIVLWKAFLRQVSVLPAICYSFGVSDRFRGSGHHP